jgi:hypothetical protein
VARAMIDDLAELMRPDALDEMRWAMHDISPDELTTFEILTILTVMRQARIRVEAARATPAPLTLLRPKPVQKRRSAPRAAQARTQ